MKEKKFLIRRHIKYWLYESKHGLSKEYRERSKNKVEGLRIALEILMGHRVL
jgi:hypothetical protein